MSYVCKILVDLFLLDDPQEKGGTMLVLVALNELAEAKRLSNLALEAGNRCVIVKNRNEIAGIIDVTPSYKVEIYGRGFSAPKAEAIQFLYKYRDTYGYLAEATTRWEDLRTMHPDARISEETRMGWRE